MPRRKTSIKTKRADVKKHSRNLKIKQQLKKSVKKFLTLLSAKNATEAKDILKSVFSQLDKAVKKNVIHSGTANRKKSRLAKRLSRSA